MERTPRSGLLCVVSGPSGSGKTTLCHRLAEEDDSVRYSVSCTTRAPRPGETDGVDYQFLSLEDFRARVDSGDLLEYAQVHQKDYYGTLRSMVVNCLRAGQDVVMDLDVQGAAQLRAQEDPEIKKALVDVFILPPSIGELIARVRKRGPMSDEEEERRMANASREMAEWSKYQYCILSGDREEDFDRFRTIVEAERLRSSRWRGGEEVA